MSEPIVRTLASVASPQVCMPYDGVAGAHLFTATVSGAGSVSAAVAVEGSNDLIGWASIVTLSPSGSGSAVATASTSNSYRYVRANVSAVTGQLIVKMASETVEADTAVPPGMKPVYATHSGSGVGFPMVGDRLESGHIRSAPYPAAAIGNSLVAGTNTNNALSAAAQLPYRAPEIFQSMVNLGVGGQSSAAVLANLVANGVPDGTRYVIYHEGTNDAGSATPVSVAQHIANIRAMWDWCATRGIVFIVEAAAPVDIQGTWTSTSLARTEQYAFAERVFCAENKIPFVDPWPAWTDTDGSWNSAAAVGDGVHPPQAVHDACSIEMATQLRARRPAPLLPRSNAGAAGVYPTFGNVLNLNGAGLPTGWSQNGTAPTAISPSPAAHPVRGNWSDATLTGLSASGDFYRYLHSGGQFSAGDRVKISGYFKFTNTNNCRLAARLSLIRSVAPNSSLYLFDTSASFGETYFEGEIVVPTDLTQAALWISYKPASGSGAFSGSFSFAGFDCYNITKNIF